MNLKKYKGDKYEELVESMNSFCVGYCRNCGEVTDPDVWKRRPAEWEDEEPDLGICPSCKERAFELKRVVGFFDIKQELKSKLDGGERLRDVNPQEETKISSLWDLTMKVPTVPFTITDLRGFSMREEMDMVATVVETILKNDISLDILEKILGDYKESDGSGM